MKILKYGVGTLIVVIFFQIFAPKINAQTFGASITAGLALSQIDGDQSAGYNKPGPFISLNGIAKLKEKVDLEIGLSYIFRGSQSELFPDNAYQVLKINLQYIDVPLTIHYKDWVEPGEGFYHMDFYAGAYFGRLLSASAEYSGYDDITESFNKNEIGIVLGGGYNFSKHSGIGLKWNRGINYLFKNGTNGANQNSLINRFLQIYYKYNF
jgi:hypothetical protein